MYSRWSGLADLSFLCFFFIFWTDVVLPSLPFNPDQRWMIPMMVSDRSINPIGGRVWVCVGTDVVPEGQKAGWSSFIKVSLPPASLVTRNKKTAKKKNHGQPFPPFQTLAVPG